ncbi:MAG: hypothetical protein ACQESR_19105 [Planctomycetota bacterium]
MESGPTQAVLALVGLAADRVIRDRYTPSASGIRCPLPRANVSLA